MNGETLFEETDFFRAFPAPKDVFASRVDEHSEYLLPVGTLSLRYISREWDGEVHFIVPVEPLGGYGYPGDNTEQYHNYLCRPNWIGYRVSGEKCELACDFRYFHKAYYADNPPSTDLAREEALELPAHYRRTQQGFAQRAQFFRAHGWLCISPNEWTGNTDDMSWMRVSLVGDLGGVEFGGNWSGVSDFPESRYPDQIEDRGKVLKCDRVLPRAEHGTDFHYIGNVEMWNYMDYTNGILLVFYDPVEQIVLTTIDWT